MKDSVVCASARRGTDSHKWNEHPADVIPLSGAELEFPPPGPVLRALRARIEHPMLGYNTEPPGLREVFAARLGDLYNWKVNPEALVFLPGVVPGVNLACRAFASAGEAVVVQPPVFEPILDAAAVAGLQRVDAPLIQAANGDYVIDLDLLEERITSTCRILMLCNPQNPTGRAFTRQELQSVANICLRRGLIVCSDEIYCDWVFDGARHVPIASLGPDIADRCVTLMGTAKSHNIPGVRCGIAVVENQELRSSLQAQARGLSGSVGIFEFAAALAAYREGDSWLKKTLTTVETNRGSLAEYVASNLPGIEMVRPQATTAAWLDCRPARIPGNPVAFFLERARVALNDGQLYGPGGQGFVRLAFGCPQPMLLEGLERMRKALSTL